MIYLTGDTHGKFERLRSNYFYAGKGDYVIICGDFGNLWDNSKTEQYWRKWLREKPFTVLFVDGNHENYDMLYSYPVAEWNGGKVHKVADNIIHLMRGQIFNIDGVRFFTMGGASSHDIDAGILDPNAPDFAAKRKKLDREMALYRINRVSWWVEEIPSKEEFQEGLDNLQRVGYLVDVVITHCLPSSVQDIYSRGQYKHDSLTDYLDSIKEHCNYKLWFCGHYHTNSRIGEKFVMLYNEKIRLDEWIND